MWHFDTTSTFYCQKYGQVTHTFLVVSDPPQSIIQSGLQIIMKIGEVCYTYITWKYIPIFLHSDAKISYLVISHN